MKQEYQSLTSSAHSSGKQW